jgi:PAS domain S-box-containing protein
MVGVAQDITARKRDEADLAHLAFVVESVDDGIVSLDVDGRVRTWNPAAERIYGLTASEAHGRLLQDLVEPPDAHTFPELLAMVKRGVPVHDTEGVHRRRDGTRLTVSLALALILVGDEVTGVAATIRDVSARKLYERKLRQHLADLEEADRRKDHFLAMLGHELRNPLSPIMNSAQLIRHAGSDRALLERSTTVIERQVEHLTRLIDDLLDVARITEGKIVLKRERRDLMPLLYQALEATRAMIEARSQRLVIEAPASAVDLDADPVRLVQVFTNLLTNATKYTPEGGEIHLTAVREGDAAVIRIRDNGLGIAPDMLPRLFVPFSQASEALDRAQGGLGIGLALVKRLVEMHGGTVAAGSGGRGRGSEFTVTLPLASDVPLAARDEPAPRPAGSPPSLDCLVVDDNVDAADSLAALLQASGHRTVVCYEAASALRAIDYSPPQLAILDIGLPGMDGYELARRVRARESGRHIFLAALTGYGQPSDAERAREAGFDMHLVKPLLPDVMARLVARVVEAHPGTRADIERAA